MPSALRPTPFRLLALAALALVAALLANAVAPPARRLAWSASLAAPPAMPPPRSERVEAPVTPKAPDAPVPTTPGPRPVPKATPRVIPSAVPTPPKPQEPPPSQPIREITSAEAWAAFQARVPFLDARRSAEFTEGHIAGAWCTPVWEADLGDRLIDFKAARRPGADDPIVIYCSGGDCRDSHLLAARLLNEGYFHLLIYRDGFPDWVKQNHPIAKGQP